MIDLSDLIGTPFAYGGRGPDVYDCWGLLMVVYRRWHGVELPDYRSSKFAARNALTMARGISLWRERERGPGVGVLLRVNGVASHVGFMIDDDRFIHTWEESGGVVIEPIWGDWEHRVVGYYSYAA